MLVCIVASNVNNTSSIDFYELRPLLRLITSFYEHISACAVDVLAGAGP